MSGIRSQRWPIVEVIIGLGLVVGGVQLSHFTGLTEFTYSVTATTQATATDAAQSSSIEADVIYRFTELPSTAQDAFLRAYEAADNEITIRGMEHQVTELAHTGDTPARPGGGLYYVVYQGSYYEFTIRHPMAIGGFSTLFGYALAFTGFIYGTYGSLKHNPRTRPLLALVCGVAAFFAVYSVTDWWWGLNDLPTLLVVGALCVYLPAVGVWSIYRALRS